MPSTKNSFWPAGCDSWGVGGNSKRNCSDSDWVNAKKNHLNKSLKLKELQSIEKNLNVYNYV